jgi:hypothetical protein
LEFFICEQYLRVASNSILAQEVVLGGALVVDEARGGEDGHAAVRAPLGPALVWLIDYSVPHAQIDQWHAAAAPLVPRRRQGAQVGGRGPKVGGQKIQVVCKKLNYL